MRKILFKAKRSYNGEWVEGYYVQEDDNLHYIYTGKMIVHNYLQSTSEYYKIDETTLCQYTGKTDINKNKIWENDIVKEGCNGLIAKVIWDEELATYRLDGLGPDYLIRDASIEWEVIGNIFDNPELLQYNERDER